MYWSISSKLRPVMDCDVSNRSRCKLLITEFVVQRWFWRSAALSLNQSILEKLMLLCECDSGRWEMFSVMKLWLCVCALMAVGLPHGGCCVTLRACLGLVAHSSWVGSWHLLWPPIVKPSAGTWAHARMLRVIVKNIVLPSPCTTHLLCHKSEHGRRKPMERLTKREGKWRRWLQINSSHVAVSYLLCHMSDS